MLDVYARTPLLARDMSHRRKDTTRNPPSYRSTLKSRDAFLPMSFVFFTTFQCRPAKTDFSAYTRRWLRTADTFSRVFS